MKQTIHLKNGLNLSYIDRGDPAGFPLLTQHGLIASIEDTFLFDRIIQAGARVISIARPGYGDSSPWVLNSYLEWADLVGQVIDELNISSFDVLGMSSGAPYSYALGARFPERVRFLYIFSGLPAFYDEKVLSLWPHPPIRGKTVVELEPLAREIFFSWVTEADKSKNDIRDSMANDCFGVAQDLRLRFVEWGFTLADVKACVFMRQSKEDEPYLAAVRTAELLPNCQLELLESGPHFSPEALGDFIQITILSHFQAGK